MDIIKEESFPHSRLLTSTSFIGKFVHPLGGGGMGRVKVGIIILTSYEFNFIREHENLV